MPKYLLTILLLLAVICSCHAQPYRRQDFVQYTVREGLSDNNITCLQQDEWGYIWAGTDAGLNRFDGHVFKAFLPSSESPTLLSGKITKLKTFGQHQLGIISHGGLQVFNTQNFYLHDYIIADSTPLTTYRNTAWDAVERHDGGFILTTASGLYAFDSTGKLGDRHDAYTLADIGKKKILYGRDILNMGDGKYLAYVEEDKLAVYNEAKKSYAEIPSPTEDWKGFYTPQSPGGNLLGTKYQLNNHQFIFINSVKDSIALYDHQTKTTVYSPLPFRCKEQLNWNSKITMLDSGHFAINCSNYGFYLFAINRQTGVITCDGEKQMPSCEINCIFTDKENRLWLGTHNGLLRQRLKASFITNYSYTAPVTKGGYAEFFSSAYRYKNKLYLASYSRNAGLSILDTATMKIEKQIHFYGDDNMWNEVISIQMYYADTLWLGTNGGILWFDTKTNRYGNVLKDLKNIPVDIAAKIAYKPGHAITVNLAPANGSEAWMAFGLQGIVARYSLPSRAFTFFTADTKPALPFNRVKQVLYDSYGGVWLSGNALARWNNSKQLFDTLITVYGGAKKFNTNIVAISADDSGSLWLHNEENGLLEYRVQQKKFIAYGSENGLPYNVFESFSPVIKNTVWMAGATALTAFDTHTKKATVYDYSDGFPDHEPTGRRIYYDTIERCFYLFCGNTVAKFPLTQPPVNYGSSAILIQQLSANNSNIINQPADGIQLSPDSNNVTINFTVVDFEEGNSYTFDYRLNNAETWVSLGQQRSLALNGLRPGKYVIQLRATSKQGIQKTKAFVFVIQPHFWQTTWFILLASAIVFITMYILYRNRIRDVRQKANIDRQLAQMEMKALHAQMNPHFIFNSLNSIKEMVLNNENNEASNYLSKFARMIRITLEQSSHTFVTLRSTVDYLNRYVEMEKIRNGYFTCAITVDEMLDQDEIVLPPMLIQPFIENSIWHGIEPTHKTIHIQVVFAQAKGQLICTIEDNGVGISQSVANKQGKVLQGKSYGIANIKERIALLNEKYNLQSKVGIIDKSTITALTTGTIVTIELPLQMLNE